ncbi:hypothetical protein D3C86_1665160 [compost metagenome]
MTHPRESGADKRHFAHLRVRRERLERVQQRGVVRQLVQRLVVITQRQTGMDFKFIRRLFRDKLLPDKLHQRGFPAAIAPDNRHAIAAFEPCDIHVKQRRETRCWRDVKRGHFQQTVGPQCVAAQS